MSKSFSSKLNSSESKYDKKNLPLHRNSRSKSPLKIPAENDPSLRKVNLIILIDEIVIYSLKFYMKRLKLKKKNKIG